MHVSKTFLQLQRLESLSFKKVIETAKGIKLELDEMPVSSGLDYKIITAGLETMQTKVKKLQEKSTNVTFDYEIEELITNFLKRKH